MAMDLITEQLDLAKLTKLPQRLAQLETQPLEIGDIFPRHKHLMIKRSQRCRRCEHNLSKPEYNPTSIKFKIQLAAYYHVPELVIYKVDKLVAGVQAKFVIKVVNPTNTGTEFEFLSMKAYQVRSSFLTHVLTKENCPTRSDTNATKAFQCIGCTYAEHL